MKALFSIKPEFVKKIFSGVKKVEYRKRIFKKDIDTIVVYSTKPVGKIVGEIKIDCVLVDKPERLWDQTGHYSGVSHLFFQQYFEGKSEGYAIKIKEARLYKKPIDPKELDASFKAPQSFCYIEEAFLK